MLKWLWLSLCRSVLVIHPITSIVLGRKTRGVYPACARERGSRGCSSAVLVVSARLAKGNTREMLFGAWKT